MAYLVELARFGACGGSTLDSCFVPRYSNGPRPECVGFQMTMAPDLGDTANCPVRNIVDRIGDRWSLLVISALAHGKMVPFSDIKRQIGDISPRMLSQTLRRLEQDGYVVRTVYPTIPEKVEYCLSDLGRSLLDPLGKLIAWANEYFHLVLQARKAYIPPLRNGPL